MFCAGPIKPSKLASGKIAQPAPNERKIEFADPSLVEEHVASG